MIKRELMEAVLTEKELSCTDVAYPQPWADKVRQLGLNPEYIVWCYAEDRVFGKPIDLAHRFLQKYQKITDARFESDDPDYVEAVISANNMIMKQLGI
jgi:hypothetical protein